MTRECVGVCPISMTGEHATMDLLLLEGWRRVTPGVDAGSPIYTLQGCLPSSAVWHVKTIGIPPSPPIRKLAGPE